MRDHIPALRPGLRVRVGEQVELVKLQIVQVRVLPRQVAQDSLEGTVQLGGSYRVPAMCPHLLLKAAVEMSIRFVTRSSPIRGASSFERWNAGGVTEPAKG